MENFDKLSYDPETGVFKWLVSPSKIVKAGQLAGTINKPDGYLVIKYANKIYKAHRLAWIFTYGKFPDGVIDHIDGNPLNNKISNLRDVSQLVNNQNHKSASSNNKTGFLGVCWNERDKKFQAGIRVNGKQKHIGCFTTAEEAHEAYLKAKRKLHEGCTI